MIELNLSLVLKTVEKCNLNCNYCYFFNGQDVSYKNKPIFIQKNTIDNLAKFLKEGSQSINLKKVTIALHGGEPLMQPKQDFIYLIETLQNTLPNIDFLFSIQTNATLVTPKWIELLNKYDVAVGVSIDGPKEYHDKHRINHNGIGSYESVIRGIKLLQAELKQLPASLTVINPIFSGKIIYRHLVDLGFKSLDFLLPDNNYHVPSKYNNVLFIKFFLEILEEWIKDNNSEITIRKLKTIILQLLGENPLLASFGKQNQDNTSILVIRSDGEITPTDELLSTEPATVTLINKNVNYDTLYGVLNHPIFTEIRQATTLPPTQCSKCCWYNACGGGDLVSRFSKNNRFNNPSIYCSVYQNLFTHITSYLLKAGVPKTVITNNLFLNNINEYAH